MDGKKCPVPIVAKYKRQSRRCADHDVQVTVCFNIYCPRAGVISLGYRSWQLRLRGNIYEGLRIILPHQAETACARQDKIGLEVIVEIDRKNRFGGRTYRGLAPREGE